MEAVCAFSAGRGAGDGAAFARRWQAELGRSEDSGEDELYERSGESGAVSAQADSADVWRGIAVVQLDDRGPALCDRPQGCGSVEAARAEEGHGGDGRGAGGSICFDDGDGWGFCGEAD